MVAFAAKTARINPGHAEKENNAEPRAACLARQGLTAALRAIESGGNQGVMKWLGNEDRNIRIRYRAS